MLTFCQSHFTKHCKDNDYLVHYNIFNIKFNVQPTHIFLQEQERGIAPASRAAYTCVKSFSHRHKSTHQTPSLAQ